jgi:hypothetical protein
MNNSAFIKSRFPINDLKKIGFFHKNDSFEDMERKICRYFGLKNIYEYDYILPNKKEIEADLKTFSIN